MSVVRQDHGRGSDVGLTQSERNKINNLPDNTVSELSKKEPSIAEGTESQYLRGDKTWQTLNKSAVGLGNADNTSDVSKPISTAAQTALNLKEDKANKGIPGGYAGLDSNTKLLLANMPDFILGQVLYGGTFNASTATATLSNNARTRLGTALSAITLTNNTTAITGYSANEGIYYITDTVGTFASISFDAGDWLISTGSAWKKIDNTDAVTGIKGNAESTYRIGNVNITAANIGLGNVPNEDWRTANLTKTNTTDFTPTADYHPATKKYVDESVTPQYSKTYSDLKTLRQNKQLVPGAQYLLTDYITKYRQPYTNVIKTTGIDGTSTGYEKLVLTAVSTNEFSPIVASLGYPKDVVYYDFDDNICEDGSTARNGFIQRRIDTVNVVDMPHDWRHMLWARFKATATKWTSGSVVRRNIYQSGTGLYIATRGGTPTSATDPNYFQLICGTDDYFFTGAIDYSGLTYNNRFEIPRGLVADTSYRIPELPKPKTTAWDVICDALSLTYKATGIRYYPICTGEKISLIKRRENILQWVIETGVNLEDYKLSKSIENIKTRIKLLSKEGNVLAESADSLLEKKVGVFQDVVQIDDEMNAGQLNQLVKTTLEENNKPERVLTVSALGLPDVTTGIGVFIIIKELGISRTYYVEEDTHTFKGDYHSMNLKLVLALDVNKI